MYFVGIDLAWGDRKPTGVAVLDADGLLVHVSAVRSDDEITEALAPYVSGECLVGIDAPLIVRNATGNRPAEAALNRDFARFEAGAHPSNTSKPEFSSKPRGARICDRLGLDMNPRSGRPRRAIEVYPHPATIALFRLGRTLKYKNKPGRDREELRGELLILMGLIEGLGSAQPPLLVDRRRSGWAQLAGQVGTAGRKSELRVVEDQVDAVLCAYVALFATREPDRTTTYGDFHEGYIVTPTLPAGLDPTPKTAPSPKAVATPEAVATPMAVAPPKTAPSPEAARTSKAGPNPGSAAAPDVDLSGSDGPAIPAAANHEVHAVEIPDPVGRRRADGAGLATIVIRDDGVRRARTMIRDAEGRRPGATAPAGLGVVHLVRDPDLVDVDTPETAGTGPDPVAAAVREYSAQQETIADAGQRFVALVTAILDEAGINYLSVTGRAKSIESFAGKAARRVDGRLVYADPIRDITDQIGVRVITYVLSDVAAVADLMNDQVVVKDDRDMGRETASQGRFGYSSRHLLIALDAARESQPAYEQLRGRVASMQIRTVLQHAWAEFEHDIRYKGTVPAEHASEFDRRFTLAAGLLELADREFSQIRDRLQVGPAQRSEPEDDDPRLDPRELAAFLAGQYADAGWSRTDHYAWISGLLLELGITSLDELSEMLRPMNELDLNARMDYRYPPGAVRRLDDALLAAFGTRYVDLHGNAHRVPSLRARLERLQRGDLPGQPGSPTAGDRP